MIQVFEANKKPSFGKRFSDAVGAGVEGGKELYDKYQAQQNLKKTQAMLSDATKMDWSGISDPNQLKEGIHGLMQERAQKLKGLQGSEEDDKRTAIIEKQFGPKAAQLYNSATEGGKSTLMSAFVEGAQRNQNFEEILNGLMGNNQQTQPPQPQNQQAQPGAESSRTEETEPEIPTIKTKDYDKGLTPKERASRQDKRYSTNLPLYQEQHAKNLSYESDKENLGILQELSPKIGAIERLNIHPQSGDLIVPALASEEAQRFVKTVNDFTRNAKDSYGSRVTNFDLTQFMKRLPTLANSEEGRASIIKQLQIINDINLARSQALQEVIDEHGGIRNIDYDEAERLADKRSSKEVAKMKGEFRNIDSKNEKVMQKKIDHYKSITPKGSVAVQFNDGNFSYIPKNKVDEFVKDKAGKVL